MRKPSLKIGATLLCALLFLTNSVFAHALETNFWTERRSAENKPTQVASLPFALPAVASAIKDTDLAHASLLSSPRQVLGRGQLSDSHHSNNGRTITTVESNLLSSIPSSSAVLREILKPSHANNKTIIHIQDVHLNAEAQSNIEDIVTHLSDKIDLVALEGAFDEVDFSAYQNYPDQKIIQAVGDWMKKTNRLSGAAHSVFVGGRFAPSLIGIDDQPHYQSNVDAYLDSLSQKAAVTEALTQISSALEKKRHEIFSPALIKFDDTVSQYHARKIPLTVYAQQLTQDQNAADLNLQSFVEAAALESALNFKQVEVERTSALAALLNHLSKQESENLLAESIAFRTGELSQADFYHAVLRLFAQKNVDIRKYSSFDKYIRYVLLAESISAEKLFAALHEAETQRYSSLATNIEQKKLVEDLQQLRLARKLVSFELTSSEWKEWRGTTAYARLLSPFLRFYEEANARNAAMAHNLASAMENRDASTAVLVTGGFHSAGVDALLVSGGFRVISISPKLTKVEGDQGSTYLSVFAQEKTPLDKLFAGEKLFVSPNPVQTGGAAGAVVLHQQALSPNPLGPSAGNILRRFSNSPESRAFAIHLKSGSALVTADGIYREKQDDGVIQNISFFRWPTRSLGRILCWLVAWTGSLILSVGASQAKNFEIGDPLSAPDAFALHSDREHPMTFTLGVADGLRRELLTSPHEKALGVSVELGKGSSVDWIDVTLQGEVDGSVTNSNWRILPNVVAHGDQMSLTKVAPLVEGRRRQIFIPLEQLGPLTNSLTVVSVSLNGTVDGTERVAVSPSARLFTRRSLENLLLGEARDLAAYAFHLKANGQSVDARKYYFLATRLAAEITDAASKQKLDRFIRELGLSSGLSHSATDAAQEYVQMAAKENQELRSAAQSVPVAAWEMSSRRLPLEGGRHYDFTYPESVRRRLSNLPFARIVITYEGEPPAHFDSINGSREQGTPLLGWWLTPDGNRYGPHAGLTPDLNVARTTHESYVLLDVTKKTISVVLPTLAIGDGIREGAGIRIPDGTKIKSARVELFSAEPQGAPGKQPTVRWAKAIAAVGLFFSAILYVGRDIIGKLLEFPEDVFVRRHAGKIGALSALMTLLHIGASADSGNLPNASEPVSTTIPSTGFYEFVTSQRAVLESQNFKITINEDTGDTKISLTRTNVAANIETLTAETHGTRLEIAANEQARSGETVATDSFGFDVNGTRVYSFHGDAVPPLDYHGANPIRGMFLLPNRVDGPVLELQLDDNFKRAVNDAIPNAVHGYLKDWFTPVKPASDPASPTGVGTLLGAMAAGSIGRGYSPSSEWDKNFRSALQKIRMEMATVLDKDNGSEIVTMSASLSYGWMAKWKELLTEDEFTTVSSLLAAAYIQARQHQKELAQADNNRAFVKSASDLFRKFEDGNYDRTYLRPFVTKMGFGHKLTSLDIQLLAFASVPKSFRISFWSALNYVLHEADNGAVFDQSAFEKLESSYKLDEGETAALKVVVKVLNPSSGRSPLASFSFLGPIGLGFLFLTQLPSKAATVVAETATQNGMDQLNVVLGTIILVLTVVTIGIPMTLALRERFSRPDSERIKKGLPRILAFAAALLTLKSNRFHLKKDHPDDAQLIVPLLAAAALAQKPEGNSDDKPFVAHYLRGVAQIRMAMHKALRGNDADAIKALAIGKLDGWLIRWKEMLGVDAFEATENLLRVLYEHTAAHTRENRTDREFVEGASEALFDFEGLHYSPDDANLQSFDAEIESAVLSKPKQVLEIAQQRLDARHISFMSALNNVLGEISQGAPADQATVLDVIAPYELNLKETKSILAVAKKLPSASEHSAGGFLDNSQIPLWLALGILASVGLPVHAAGVDTWLPQTGHFDLFVVGIMIFLVASVAMGGRKSLRFISYHSRLAAHEFWNPVRKRTATIIFSAAIAMTVLLIFIHWDEILSMLLTPAVQNNFFHATGMAVATAVVTRSPKPGDPDLEKIADVIANSLLNGQDGAVTSARLSVLLPIQPVGLNDLRGEDGPGFRGLRRTQVEILSRLVAEKIKGKTIHVKKNKIWNWILSAHVTSNAPTAVENFIGNRHYALALEGGERSSSEGRVIASLLRSDLFSDEPQGRKLVLLIPKKDRMKPYDRRLWQNPKVKIIYVSRPLRSKNFLDVGGMAKALVRGKDASLLTHSYLVIPEGVDRYDLSFIDAKWKKMVNIALLTDLLQGFPISGYEINNMMSLYRVIRQQA